jgi:hypothetical protein
MLTQTIVRGNIVEIRTTFADIDGAAVDPLSAIATINFVSADNIRETVNFAMEVDTDGTWFALWDSSEALQGRVYWSILATDPASADEGFFELKANLANLNAGTTT